MNKNIVKIILGLVVVGLLVSFSIFFLMRPPKAVYQYDQPTKKSIVETVETEGKVKAADSVDLSFERSGKISRVNVQIGDKVKAGQILATLENADAAAQLNQAKAVLDKQLAGFTSDYLAQLQAGLDKAKADLSSVEGIVPGVENSKLVQNAYDDMAANLQSVQTVLYSSLVAADDILGMDNTYGNDSFEPDLSVSDKTKIDIAKYAYLSTKKVKDDFDSNFNSLGQTPSHAQIDGTIEQGENALIKMKELLYDVAVILDNTEAIGHISPSFLSGLKNNILTARNSVATRYATLIAQTHAIDAARNNYYSLQALVSKAEASLNDAKNLPRDVDTASNRAAVDLAQANYNKTLIYAPFEGVVTRSDAKVGAIFSPGLPLVSLISDKKFQVDAYVSEADISKVKVGQAANITLDNVGNGEKFPAIVIKVNPAGEVVGNGVMAYKITSQINQNDERIKAGVSANVSVITAEVKEALAIPSKDIIQKNGEYYVMVNKENKNSIEQKVVLGVSDKDGWVEIKSGLTESDKVVSFVSNK